ncbi:hypothetical protein NL676_015690 [Syzygium grande]|nr:hypothetical protein NL676_015690 [Syzygium grande]
MEHDPGNSHLVDDIGRPAVEHVDDDAVEWSRNEQEPEGFLEHGGVGEGGGGHVGVGADMSELGGSEPGGNSREWMEMGRPESWLRAMEHWKERALLGAATMVDLTQWEARRQARSIMGTWWPPPTEGKKNISTSHGSRIGFLSKFVWSLGSP